MAMGPAPRIPQVDPREARRKLDEPATDALLVDVREEWEYIEVRAPEATLIPLSQFAQRFSEIPRDREALLVCHTGQRSQRAALFLRQQGYERVANVSGGMEAWESAGLPVERGKP